MFELSEFELSGVNYYKKYCQIQEELGLVRVSEEFELSEFQLAGDYCILLFSSNPSYDVKRVMLPKDNFLRILSNMADDMQI